jgi:hypothetical protein
MPSSAPGDLPLTELTPGYLTNTVEWGELRVAFDHMHAGQDLTSNLDELPGGRCNANHWGYLFKGSFRADWEDGRSETVEAGQAFYIAPGHKITALEDFESLQFTPTKDIDVTLAAMRSYEAKREGDG